jgi:hypothetical protein
MEYVRDCTGTYQDTLVAELINAATDALSLNETHTEESLKKFRQRIPLRRRKQAQYLGSLGSIFPKPRFWGQ